MSYELNSGVARAEKVCCHFGRGPAPGMHTFPNILRKFLISTGHISKASREEGHHPLRSFHGKKQSFTKSP